MFDKEGFQRYVGISSANSYASGLANVERIYAPVDIDIEFENDECAELLKQLEMAKNEDGIDSSTKSRRQDNYSHLKKYICYKRYRKFVSWMKEQPQRDDSEKKYSDATVLAAAECIHKGLGTLPNFSFRDKDCFAITSANEFQKIYDRCYEKAEEYDKNHGHRDYRNGLEYYLAFLKGTSMSKDMITENIKEIINAYKNDFQRVNSEERYKWEAILYYKQNWNIDASDFVEMLSNAFKKSSNLLAAAMYYPLRMVMGYAKEEPETVRELFRVLHNEKLPFTERYEMFRSGFEKYVSEKKLNHYQDLRAISVYLTFEYPEKYYMYKYRMYKSFKEKISYAENSVNKSDDGKYDSYLQLCNKVLEVVRQDKGLQELSKSRLDENCYTDEALHILTHDIIYFGSKLEDKADTEGYWPSLEEYDPDLTSEDWKKFILEVEKPNHPSPMNMLKFLIEEGGEASCKQLAMKYGGTASAYVGCAVNLGKRAKKYFDLPPCMDEGQERYFPIPFLGKSIIEDGKKAYIYKIRPELMEALKEIDFSDIPLRYEDEEENGMTDVNLNTILYGPPGTGKTYNTVIYAVAIIENRTLQSVKEEEYAEVFERYNNYKEEGLIEFTTFHQSYGYEEFIEGIKPVMNAGEDVNNDVQYEISSGLFKNFCERAERPVFKQTKNEIGINKAPTIWKVSLEGTGDNPTRTECMENGHIRIGWDSYGEVISEDTTFESGGKSVLNAFIYKMKVGDIVLSCYSSTTIDAIGVVSGEYEWHDEYEKYKRLRNVNWIVKNIREDITAINNGISLTLSSVYKLNVSLADVMALVAKNATSVNSVKDSKKNYVFVIDEINRGNISKIFGELITLIEESKRVGRPEGMKAKLPYSQQQFGVPSNVYIIGTMNTADRSIATIDTALRRRFRFKEMLPDASVLEGIYVEDVSIRELLEKMNKRISVLYDREHTLGHAYFVPLKLTPTLEALGNVFADSIIPLLQEYFYEDYEKIRMVLGDNNKTDELEQFIKVVESNFAELFGSVEYEFDDARSYEINKDAFGNIEAYRKI